MSRVFISYRRSDCSELAAALSAQLKQHIPEAAVFLDIERIDVGEDFSTSIFKHISGCEIVILLISKSWIDALSSQSGDECDWVKMETETALRLNKIVIPIVTEHDSDFYNMKLPGSIRDLHRLNCMELLENEDEFTSKIAKKTAAILAQSKQARIERLGQKISKSATAIKHVWKALGHATVDDLTEPDPEDIWDAVIAIAKLEYGEKRWQRTLKNIGLEQSEDVGLIIFACVVEGFFLVSESDNPSDYWGLGTIYDKS